jgi:hypothetical protein
MLIECPVCKKENEACGDPMCLRCGSDLSPLQSVLQAATWHLAMAAERLRGQDWQEAFNHADRSWKLRHSDAAARLAFLASSALGDSRLAARWYESAQRMCNQNSRIR